MKYVIDLDAFVECLDCLDTIRVNGELYVDLPLLKEFINRFPKDAAEPKYSHAEYSTSC